MKNLIRTAALLAVVGVGAACDLKVQNPNQPETARVLATPADVESLMASYYKRWHSGMWGTLSNIEGMANVQSFEDYSSLSNNCLGQRYGIPRPANDNSIGNGCAAEQLRVYAYMAETNRVASSILGRLATPGFTLGGASQNNRAVAFSQFLRGISLGYLSLFYDSAAITTATTPADSAGDLRSYVDVNAAALVALQAAIDAANASGTTSTGFPLPGSWIPSTTTMSQAEFIKLCHSYMARFRAGVARTPTERAAVNWATVITDAQAGITADHDNITNTVTGPFNSWLDAFYSYTTWHQMTPFIIGMADVSGSYKAWLAQPLASRGSGGAFFMQTPDLRWPQGATRAAQNADFALAACNGAAQTCPRYFVNRPAGNDVASGSAWGLSNYDHARFWSWRTSGDAGQARNGKLIFMSKTEISMLAAEGMIRTGNFAGALALINQTRVPNGLAALVAPDNTTPVPGGANCVPQIPIKANYQADGSFTAPQTTCGTMMEAMKWEKRMETAYTGFAQWFVDSRGWGDLVVGTGTTWPVPYQDLQARLHNVYSTGGTINPYSAAQSGYGW